MIVLVIQKIFELISGTGRKFGALSFRVRSLTLVFCLFLSSGLLAADIANSDFSDDAAIEQRLQQVQEELREHASDTDGLSYDLLQRLESTIYHHQAAVEFLAAKEIEREKAFATTRAWAGFDQPGPYSILFSDDLRLQLVELQYFQRATEARLRIISEIKETAAEQLLAHQSTDRQLTEMTEMGDTLELRQQALISLQQNAMSLRTDVEKRAYVDLRFRALQAEVDSFTAGQELLQLQLQEIEGQTVFSQSELDEILQRIASERKWAIDKLDEPDNVAYESNAQVAWLAEFLDVEEKFWSTRHAALASSSLKGRNMALATFREMQTMSRMWAQVAKSLADDRLLKTGESAKELAISDELQRIKRLQSRIDFAISEMEDSAGFGMSLLSRVSGAAVSIWNSELYLVEDKASIEGKKVSTFRAITFGKLIKLVLILTAGWFMLKFLSRRLRTLATARLGRSPASANSIARWTFGAGLGLLIIYALKTVNIPFTAFAFLGGTLAIGIGFGAQTLVKNFISGIILLLERPFKVGDLIEVDGVTGQILRIGMRASVIEHFDGIETLVPNSVLLDNRVDNWTFGKTAIRGAVSVGVAYGSPTRETSKALLAAAVEHGQVLDRPEAEVRFEEFGDSSLVFRLLYWVNATNTQRERVNSDLRYMIDKALIEAGITVAFPQRDIHFDTTQPLRVEVSSSDGRASSPKRRRVTD